MTIRDDLRSAAFAYFASTKGTQMSEKPIASQLAPVWSVDMDTDVATHHYWRFILGAADDHAIAGWAHVMTARDRAARKAARQLEVAIAALNRKRTA